MTWPGASETNAGGRSGRRVLVVGAGVGGLSAAAHLARAGFDVTVLEKNPRAGGRCDRIERDGHRFDTGPTLFVLPQLFEAEFSALGTRLQDQLELVRVDPTYRVVFESSRSLSMTSDLEAMRVQLEAMEAGSFAGLLEYLGEGRRHYDGAVETFVRRDFRRAREMLSPATLSSLLRLKPLTSHYRSVGRFFRSERLRAAFTFQDAYMGMSPTETPSTFSLIPFSELTHGVWYPRGGMYRVIEALTRLAAEQGVRFRFRADVRRIAMEGDRAAGVILRSGAFIPADIVVANADLPYVYDHLLPPLRSRPWTGKRRFSYSSISFFWGVDRPIEQVGPHTLFLADDYVEGFRELARGKALPAVSNVYLHAPARIDTDMAPRGQDTLIAIVSAAHLDPRRSDDWKALKDVARRNVHAWLAKLGVRDLQRHIKFELTFTPRSWQRRYNLAHGALHGLRNQVTQLGGLRPHNRHHRFHNVYFAGASTHPGTGVPTAMVSGRLAAERITEEWPTRERSRTARVPRSERAATAALRLEEATPR